MSNAHRRAQLTNPALACTERLRLDFQEAVLGLTTIHPVGSKSKPTWNDAPTPILGNPVLPQEASVSSPE